VAVEIWFRDSLESEVVEGDLIALTNSLNIAAANGKQFTILDSPKGDVMVQTRNILRAREAEGVDAYIGG
jgi:hypothetical protein